MAQAYLQAVGRKPVMVIDRGARTAPEWPGVQVMHPDDVCRAAKETDGIAVSVVNAPYIPIQQELTAQGFKHVVPFYDLTENYRKQHPLANGWFAPVLFGTPFFHTTNVSSLWADDISRAQHIQFIAWRRAREEWTFDGAPVNTFNRYFIPEITKWLGSNETFVDVGAYHGRVINTFLRCVGGSYNKIIAIEPDQHSNAVLTANLNGMARLTVYDFAAGKEDGLGLFHGGLGYSSQLSPTGITHVTVKALDRLRLKPTFMKVHTEGSELQVLQGAKQTLMLHRPIVAVTVYHNSDGIWKTPLWLMEKLPDYQFYFRLHSWCGTGAVLYAIPNERTAI
jgi:FkbM family methyltransferase